MVGGKKEERNQLVLRLMRSVVVARAYAPAPIKPAPPVPEPEAARAKGPYSCDRPRQQSSPTTQLRLASITPQIMMAMDHEYCRAGVIAMMSMTVAVKAETVHIRSW